MKPRSPIARASAKRIKKAGGKLYSTISSPRKPIRKVNPIAKAKRTAGYRKMLSGKEYKVARAEAMARAGKRCEWNASDQFGLGDKTERDPFRNDPARCANANELHAHHLRYPKSRPVAVTDLVILCDWHHRLAEGMKPGKTRMF